MTKNVKNTTIFKFLDLLIPPSCLGCGRLGAPICDRCKNYIICCNFYNKCPRCKRPLPVNKDTGELSHECLHCPDLPPIYAVGLRDDLLETAIHEYKFSSNRSLAASLADLLDKKLPETLPKNTILVPLPTVTKHIRSRGFDHIALLAKELQKRRSDIKIKNLLLRNKNTVQVGTDQKTRKRQAAEAYVVNGKIKIDPLATYLLLDDVWTTGASMLAALEKLRSAGAKNFLIAILSVNK